MTFTSTQKRHSLFVSATHKPPYPIGREPQNFWAAGNEPSHIMVLVPGTSTNRLLRLNLVQILVLCNDKNGVRVITSYNVASDGSVFRLPHIQHQNFVNIYELCHFKGRLFAISEYLDFFAGRSTTTLHPSNRAGDSIYNQSSKICIILYNSCANAIGFGRYTIHLVKKVRTQAHISMEYSALSR
jgi:hypothetical protein